MADLSSARVKGHITASCKFTYINRNSSPEVFLLEGIFKF